MLFLASNVVSGLDLDPRLNAMFLKLDDLGGRNRALIPFASGELLQQVSHLAIRAIVAGDSLNNYCKKVFETVGV